MANEIEIPPALAARYRPLSRLGQGGMGVVFLAEDRQLGRNVALKLILPQIAGQLAVARFQREARIMAKIRHPGVVAILDADLEGPAPFLSMEALEGTTLAERLFTGPMPTEEVRAFLAGSLEALACMHDHGILHRDLKPSNLFLDHHRGPVILDLGLAREAASATVLTRTGAALGSPRYMAPELLRGGPATVTSDLFALGLSAFEALSPLDVHTGERRTLGGHKLERIFSSLLSGAYLEVARSALCAEGRLGEVVLRSLAVDPAGRFPTTAAMREALFEAVPGSQVAASTTAAMTPQASGPAITADLPPPTPGTPASGAHPRVDQSATEPGIVPSERWRGAPLAFVALALVGLLAGSGTVGIATRDPYPDRDGPRPSVGLVPTPGTPLTTEAPPLDARAIAELGTRLDAALSAEGFTHGRWPALEALGPGASARALGEEATRILALARSPLSGLSDASLAHLHASGPDSRDTYRLLAAFEGLARMAEVAGLPRPRVPFPAHLRPGLRPPEGTRVTTLDLLDGDGLRTRYAEEESFTEWTRHAGTVRRKLTWNLDLERIPEGPGASAWLIVLAGDLRPDDGLLVLVNDRLSVELMAPPGSAGLATSSIPPWLLVEGSNEFKVALVARGPAERVVQTFDRLEVHLRP